MNAPLAAQSDSTALPAGAPAPNVASLRTLAYASQFKRLTHYLFRYPAKFHPPVVAELIRSYTDAGDVIYDPFCGSGTALVEALVAGRHAVGSDLDPVALFVTETKTHRYGAAQLRSTAAVLQRRVEKMRRSSDELLERRFVDISREELATAIRTSRLWIPAIPRIEHWFRRYVILDLARIRRAIITLPAPQVQRSFFLLAFASIIRNASNADPVPVSGLEVTAHMRRLEAAGRVVDPASLFLKALERNLDATEEFVAALPPAVSSRAFRADAAAPLRRHFRGQTVDAIITSPPYHNAVDYYRRHQLEMYWLQFVRNHADALELLPGYIGRHRIPAKSPALQNGGALGRLACEWVEAISLEDAQRGRDLRHYLVSMDRVFQELSPLLRSGRPLVLVVGESSWRNAAIPTVDLFSEIGRDRFTVREVLSYPVRNRYMSYERRNGADIGREYVLVLSRL